MKPSAHLAAMRMFRGWDRVTESFDVLGKVWCVRLELRTEWLHDAGTDKELIERLPRGGDAWKLVQLVKSQRRNLGLRRYGKKRR
jgi:hypothetical protein